MSAGEESQAQRAARLRRERREAKLQTGGTARLDKITSLGGRTPATESMYFQYFINTKTASFLANELRYAQLLRHLQSLKDHPRLSPFLLPPLLHRSNRLSRVQEYQKS